MAAAAGDLAAARGHHRQAERYLPDNGSLLLLSAQTAQLEGKEEVAHLKFRQMLDRRDAEFVGLRGLLAQSMKTGEFDEALTLARRAYRRSPTTPWVLTTLFELLARAEKWDEALPLIAEMQAQKLLDDAQAKHKRAVVHHMLATRLRQQDRTDDALAQARKAEKAAPDFAPAAVQAAELAQQLGRRRLALQLLETSWRSQPHPDVGRAYAQLDPNESTEKRLQRVDTQTGAAGQVGSSRPCPAGRARDAGAAVGDGSRAAGAADAGRRRGSTGCGPKSSGSRRATPRRHRNGWPGPARPSPTGPGSARIPARCCRHGSRSRPAVASMPSAGARHRESPR